MIRGRKVLNIIYGLIGLFLSYSSFMRLWAEGTFGNETHVLFLVMIGPYIGFLVLLSGLFLLSSQVFDFFEKKIAIWFSRTSFLLALLVLVTEYFIYGGTYIWSEPIDFIVFSLLTLIFYMPVIIGVQFLRNKKALQ